MDRREREALAWVNRQAKDLGRVFDAFPTGDRHQAHLFPVARLLSRILELTDRRSPGDAQFSATVTYYRYWRALRLTEASFPPSVIAFNRGFAAGEYPHLLIRAGPI